MLVKTVKQNLVGATVPWQFEKFRIIKFLMVLKKNYSYQRWFNHIAGEIENFLFPTIYTQVIVFYVVFFYLCPPPFLCCYVSIIMFFFFFLVDLYVHFAHEK